MNGVHVCQFHRCCFHIHFSQFPCVISFDQKRENPDSDKSPLSFIGTNTGPAFLRNSSSPQGRTPENNGFLHTNFSCQPAFEADYDILGISGNLESGFNVGETLLPKTASQRFTAISKFHPDAHPDQQPFTHSPGTTETRSTGKLPSFSAGQGSCKTCTPAARSRRRMKWKTYWKLPGKIHQSN